MTDLDKWKSMFDEYGIGYEISEFTNRETGETRIYLTCKEGMTKVKGYFNFVFDFEFTTNGAFIEVGIWE